MLGSAVFDQLRIAGLGPLEASRSRGMTFDAQSLDTNALIESAGLSEGDYVVNCVGLTKSRIDEKSIDSRSLAVRLNVDFPNSLAASAEPRRIRVLQVATDCVYSGGKGSYLETDRHDALDVYGKSKSLGEAPSANVMHLRCSLIGPELGRESLFFEWIRRQPFGAEINGYTNHLWNGLTSITFGKITAGIILNGLFQAGIQHLVPRDKVTKDQLVRLELAGLKRADVTVSSTQDVASVDRTLKTNNPDLNLRLFEAAGYFGVPKIGEMVEELCLDLTD